MWCLYMVRDSLGNDGGKDKEIHMYTIGIDIGKSSHVAAIMDNVGKFRVPSHKFENTKEGFQSLLQKIAEVGGSDKTQNVRIAIEATGHYWMNLYSFLKE